MKFIKADALKPSLTDGEEIAFLDVREHGQYGEGHPFFCVSLPFSRMEERAPKLLPRKSVRCVMMDNGDGVGMRAASVLEGMGYTNISVLEGGAPAWKAAGFGMFKGVNVPSKTFGELVEHELQTPVVTADQLQEWIANSEDVKIFDGRSEKEFQKMSLPCARSCPNAELGYRIPAMPRSPATKIVVNCAGRTRSIIGAENLRLSGLTDQVFALQNGTQGWRLAGYTLEHGKSAEQMSEPDAVAWDCGKNTARNLQQTHALSVISLEDARVLQSSAHRTTYFFDVRSPAEYANSHVNQAIHAPGGQLVQATDEKVAVRNAAIILSCDNGLRSTITAIWLQGMGHEVYILEEDAALHRGLAATLEPEFIKSTIDMQSLASRIKTGARVLDVSAGMDFRSAHIAGAQWGTRARLDIAAYGSIEELVVVGQCPALLSGVINELKALTGKAPRDISHSGPEDWRGEGLDVDASPNQPTDEECIDYLFFVHDRHDGNLEAARRYLEWELGLLAQLDAQERSVLRPPKHIKARPRLADAT